MFITYMVVIHSEIWNFGKHSDGKVWDINMETFEICQVLP